MSAETIARPAPAETPKPTEFTAAEHSMLDAMNVPANRQGRALLFREMQRTGLDPFAKHLYLREDWNKSANKNVYAVASTIDGFRIVAARQSTYEGQTAPQWCDKSGRWTDAWYVDAPPVAARIGVYVRGYREPMWGIARFNEYKPNGGAGFMWGKMPALMIAKVAEALAIRKAYPDQLSGVYTDDEMQQADARREEESSNGGQRPARRQTARANDEWNTVPPQAIAEQQDRDAEESQDVPSEWNTATGQPLPPPAESMPTITPEQLGQLAQLLKQKRGAVNGDRNRIISELVCRPVKNVQTLSQAEARSIIETLTAEPDKGAWPGKPAGAADAPPQQPGPAPVGTPDNPSITAPQQKALHAVLRKAGYGDRAKGLELLGRYVGRPLESSERLSKTEASSIIDKLSNGELPPPAVEQQPGPDAIGEGISEFDALDQMILDVHDQQSQMDCEDAIAAELNRGTITESDAGLLRERLAAHVERATAGASA